MTKTKFSVFVLLALLLLVLGSNCDSKVKSPEIKDVYSNQEWADFLESLGGWVPLGLPESKYRPGSIIEVRPLGDDKKGIYWIDTIESYFPPQAIKIQSSYIPGLQFTKGKEFNAKALLHILDFNAGPSFEKVSKVVFEVKNYGADTIRLLYLEDWMEDKQNKKKYGEKWRRGLEQLNQPDRYLVQEALFVANGTYTFYDKTNAKIEITTPQLKNYFKGEGKIGGEVTNDHKLLVEQPAVIAVRRAVRVTSGISGGRATWKPLKDRETGEPITADATIKQLYLEGAPMK